MQHACDDCKVHYTLKLCGINVAALISQKQQQVSSCGAESVDWQVEMLQICATVSPFPRAPLQGSGEKFQPKN